MNTEDLKQKLRRLFLVFTIMEKSGTLLLDFVQSSNLQIIVLFDVILEEPISPENVHRNLGAFLERSAFYHQNLPIPVTGNVGGFEEESALKMIEKSA